MNEYQYKEIQIGQKQSFSVTVTKDMEDKFRELTGDINPLHYDDVYAREIGEGKFLSHVTFGMLTASLLSTFAGVYMPGKYSLIHSVEVGFQKPVFAGDELTISGEVMDKQDGLNLLLLMVVFKNQHGKNVLKANMRVMVLK